LIHSSIFGFISIPGLSTNSTSSLRRGHLQRGVYKRRDYGLIWLKNLWCATAIKLLYCRHSVVPRLPHVFMQYWIPEGAWGRSQDDPTCWAKEGLAFDRHMCSPPHGHMEDYVNIVITSRHPAQPQTQIMITLAQWILSTSHRYRYLQIVSRESSIKGQAPYYHSLAINLLLVATK
jgi:hypothetical protein